MSLVKIFHFVVVRLGMRDKMRVPDPSVWCQGRGQERFPPPGTSFLLCWLLPPLESGPQGYNWSPILVETAAFLGSCWNAGLRTFAQESPTFQTMQSKCSCNPPAVLVTHLIEQSFKQLLLSSSCTLLPPAEALLPSGSLGPVLEREPTSSSLHWLTDHYLKDKSYLRLVSARINNPRSFNLITGLQFVGRDTGVPSPCCWIPTTADGTGWPKSGQYLEIIRVMLLSPPFFARALMIIQVPGKIQTLSPYFTYPSQFKLHWYIEMFSENEKCSVQ